MRGEEKMEGERFSSEMPHSTIMASETPKTCISSTQHLGLTVRVSCGVQNYVCMYVQSITSGDEHLKKKQQSVVIPRGGVDQII